MYIYIYIYIFFLPEFSSTNIHESQDSGKGGGHFLTSSQTLRH